MMSSFDLDIVTHAIGLSETTPRHSIDDIIHRYYELDAEPTTREDPNLQDLPRIRLCDIISIVKKFIKFIKFIKKFPYKP